MSDKPYMPCPNSEDGAHDWQPIVIECGVQYEHHSCTKCKRVLSGPSRCDIANAAAREIKRLQSPQLTDGHVMELNTLRDKVERLQAREKEALREKNPDIDDHEPNCDQIQWGAGITTACTCRAIRAEREVERLQSPQLTDGHVMELNTLRDKVGRLQDTIREREAELLRVRTTEIQAAVELDKHHDAESRRKFQATCDALAEALSRARHAEDFLLREGYRRCDVEACNCGSWHDHRRHALLDNLNKELRERFTGNAKIREKCEQYWNEHNICDAELHRILEQIHRWASGTDTHPQPKETDEPT